MREWLIARGFQGLEDQAVPDFPDDFVEDVSERYIELFQKLTGQPFARSEESEDPLARIEVNVKAALNRLE